MRNTYPQDIHPAALASVTGGCGRPQAPPPQQTAMIAPPEEPRRRSAEVTVGTGAAGAQAIQSAMSGGMMTA